MASTSSQSNDYNRRFRFLDLPRELQEMAMEKLDHKMALNLLQLNRYSREYLLKHGPFGRKLSRISINSEKNQMIVVPLQMAEEFSYDLDSKLHFSRVFSTRVLDFDGDAEDSLANLRKIFPRLFLIHHASIFSNVPNFERFFQATRLEITGSMMILTPDYAENFSEIEEMLLFAFLRKNAKYCQWTYLPFPFKRNWKFLKALSLRNKVKEVNDEVEMRGTFLKMLEKKGMSSRNPILCLGLEKTELEPS